MTGRWVGIGAMSVLLSPVALGQTCSGDQDFQGSYLFLATRSVAAPAPPDPGLAGPAPVFSATPIGSMIRNARGAAPFAALGRFVADGLGNLLAGPPDALYITTRVGTYRVGPDCSVSMTITDGFAASTNIFGDVLSRASVSFQGILRDRNNEGSFEQTGPTSGTLLQLARPHLASSCTNTTLSGVYGVFASGLEVKDAANGLPPETLPFLLAGRFMAEAGIMRLDLAGLESPQPKRQITGTYQVEADCTGTAAFVMDGKRRDVSLAIARGGIQFGQFTRGLAWIVINDGKVAASGEAR